MTHRLLHLPLWLLAGSMLAVAAAVALAGAWFLRHRAQEEAGEGLVALHATISTIYTVLLAFVAVIVWQEYSEAQEHVETEATRLSNVLRDSQVFPDADRTALHDAVIGYIRLASTAEWDAMGKGEAPDAATNRAYEQIWEVVYGMQPEGTVQEAFYRELLVRLNELGAARRTRILTARTNMPGPLWLLLVGGAILVLYVSSLLPAGPNPRARVEALFALSCVLALTLFLVLVFDHPASGAISIDPGPLTDLLSR